MQKTTKTLQKGFTIIELIVVIAVIGVLVLLALPKFLGYTEKAKIAQIKSEIVAKEKFIDSKRIQNDDYIKDWEEVDVATMESLKKSLFNKRGLITDSNNVEFKGKYYNVPKNSELEKMSLKMKTSSVTARSLKGDFYLGQGGEVYYYDENLAHKILGDGNGGNNGGNDGNSDGNSDGNGNNGENGNDGENGQPPVTEPDTPKEPEPPVNEKFTVTFKDYYGQTIEEKTVEKGKSVDPPLVNIKGYVFSGWDKDLTNITSDITTKALFSKGPTDKDLGYSDDDFKWIPYTYGYSVKNGQKGYFQYTGTGRSTVEIPHVIQGVPMTAYYRMFYNSPAEVTKVISTNKNVTIMNNMFDYSKATSLDVSEFDTSNVTDMSRMFWLSQATSLKFGPKFNTSKVTNMTHMFDSSEVLTLDLSTFDTSNVIHMNYMFQNSKASTLDLSTFDTSNVKYMNNMFYGSPATSITFGPKFNASNVTDMSDMFYGSQATGLDLSTFDTPKVTEMDGMFRNSQATSITFGPKFNTSKVTNMRDMFRESQVKILDLSTFDTSKVTTMGYMFEKSQATEGYARTEADAKKFNALFGKPKDLTFTVGKP